MAVLVELRPAAMAVRVLLLLLTEQSLLMLVVVVAAHIQVTMGEVV
jgi:hypothetical protein